MKIIGAELRKHFGDPKEQPLPKGLEELMKRLEDLDFKAAA